MAPEQETDMPARAQSAGKPKTSRHPVIRGFVPCIYALCAVTFALNACNDYRRIRLATELGDSILRANPQDFDELKAALGKHFGGVGYFETGDGANVGLSPRVWMRIWVTFVPGGERIQAIKMLYAGSEEIPLNEPAKHLPGFPHGYEWMIVFAVTAVPSWLWVRSVKPDAVNGFNTFAEGAGCLLALLPLIAVLPYTAIMTLRFVLMLLS